MSTAHESDTRAIFASVALVGTLTAGGIAYEATHSQSEAHPDTYPPFSLAHITNDTCEQAESKLNTDDKALTYAGEQFQRAICMDAITVGNRVVRLYNQQQKHPRPNIEAAQSVSPHNAMLRVLIDVDKESERGGLVFFDTKKNGKPNFNKVEAVWVYSHDQTGIGQTITYTLDKQAPSGFSVQTQPQAAQISKHDTCHPAGIDTTSVGWRDGLHLVDIQAQPGFIHGVVKQSRRILQTKRTPLCQEETSHPAPAKQHHKKKHHS
jgi:hypothetical protein